MNACRDITFFLLGLIALFYCSCSKKLSTPQNIPIVIQGDEALKKKVEDIIKSNPEIVQPKTGVKYHLQIIKPHPNIDYKIVRIKPHPNIDYKLIVIDPRTGKEMPKLTEEIEKGISNLLEQKRKQKEK